MSREDARTFSGTRSVARKLALQALYRWQLNDSPWQDLVQEFGEAEDMTRADAGYFRTLVEGVWRARVMSSASPNSCTRSCQGDSFSCQR